MYTAIDLLKDQIESSRETFAGTVQDIKKDHLHKHPGGTALPLAAAYAHLVFSEDAIVQGMLQGKPALYDTSWKGKTGASEPMPAMDADWNKNHTAWVRSVQLDLAQFQKYERAVYKATDAYVAGLKPEDLEKEVDLGDWGKRTVAHLISNFVIGHTHNLTGEIAAVKGVHGEKGYQF